MDKRATHKNFLHNLARVSSDSAVKALDEQAKNISAALSSSSMYEELDYNLELLDIFVVRVPERGLQVLNAFLDRLPDIELQFENDRYKDLADNLTKEALSVLSNLRFLSTTEVVTILLKYLASDDKEVSRFCAEQLKSLASYNLTALKHLGIGPQQALLKLTVELADEFKIAHASQIAEIMSALLDLTAQDTTSDYQTVTWHTGVMLANDGLAELRASTISSLADIYRTVAGFSERLPLLSAMKSATSLPTTGNYGPAIEELVMQDCERVIDFYNEIVDAADVVELEEIETQINFLKYRGAAFNPESDTLRELEEKIASNKEYAFHKVVLAGHDAFGDYWQDRANWSFDNHKKSREAEIDEIVNGIDVKNFDIWSKRILKTAERASTSSSWQYFGVFLTRLAASQPAPTLKFLKGHDHDIGRYLLPILSGLWSSSEQGEARNLVKSWIESSRNLAALASFISMNGIDDREIAIQLADKSISEANDDALSELVATAVALFERDGEFYSSLFADSLRALAGRDIRWPRWARFQKSFPDLVAKLGDDGADLILESLVKADEISFELEDILRPVAITYPSKIVPFFTRRVQTGLEKNKPNRWSSRYDAVPFRFHDLQKELAVHAALVFGQVYEWFAKDALWAWEGARFLHLIFPELPDEFEALLLQRMVDGAEKDALNVLSILKEYQGNVRIQAICKEAVKRYPESKDIRTAVLIALDATGVVSGAYGFRDAHIRKKEETASWLQSEDASVRDFASYYHEYLNERIEKETIEAERDLEVRKKVHGVRDDSAEPDKS